MQPDPWITDGIPGAAIRSMYDGWRGLEVVEGCYSLTVWEVDLNNALSSSLRVQSPSVHWSVLK